LGLIMILRNKKTVDLIVARNDQEVDIVTEVVETTKDYQLIMDFDSRGRCMESFEKEIKEFNLADMHTLQLLVNNAHFAPWIVAFFHRWVYIHWWSAAHSRRLDTGDVLDKCCSFHSDGRSLGHSPDHCCEYTDSVSSSATYHEAAKCQQR